MKNTINRRRFIKGTAILSAGSAVAPLWAAPADYDVIVIGAGLSGLHSAYLLEQIGLKVLVLEGSDRTGGRVYTLDNLDGHPELGANQVGLDYSTVRSIASRLNIPFGPSFPMSPGMAFAINKQLFNAADWPEHPANKLIAADKQTQPNWLLWNYLNKGETLASADEWLKKEKAHLDIPLLNHLKSLNASPEALRLMNLNFMGEDTATVSALQMLRKNVILKSNRGAEFIEAGTQRLTDAMTAELKSELILNKMVSEIQSSDSGVQLRCDDGSRFKAKRCIIAAPFSTVRNIDLQAPISAEKRMAINDLGYSSVIHAFIRPKAPYWESDGLSPNMWTDTPLGMVFSQLDTDSSVQRIRAWIMGRPAQALDKLPEAEIGKRVITALEKTRPASAGQLELEKVFSWNQYPFNRGAISFFKAGDITRFAKHVANAEGRIHFAGEHTDFRKSGMEAAVLSAERCVEEIKMSI